MLQVAPYKIILLPIRLVHKMVVQSYVRVAQTLQLRFQAQMSAEVVFLGTTLQNYHFLDVTSATQDFTETLNHPLPHSTRTTSRTMKHTTLQPCGQMLEALFIDVRLVNLGNMQQRKGHQYACLAQQENMELAGCKLPVWIVRLDSLWMKYNIIKHYQIPTNVKLVRKEKQPILLGTVNALLVKLEHMQMSEV